MPNSSLSGKVAIVGVDESDRIGVVPDKSMLQLHAEGARNALRDAGLTLKDVDGLFSATTQSRLSVLGLAEYLGIDPPFLGSTIVGGSSFEYHVALTNIWGLVALRLANADVLPYDFGFNAGALDHFLAELELKNKIDTHKLKLRKLHERIAEFEKAGNELREAVGQGLASGKNSAEKTQRLNEQLLQVESNWLEPSGIPGRPWFQHLLYAARYTYAHLEFPGLTEAVEKGDWKMASEQETLIEKASWEKNN